MIKGLTEWMKEYWSTMNRLCWKNKYFWIFETLLLIICYLPLGIYYLVEWIKYLLEKERGLVSPQLRLNKIQSGFSFSVLSLL